VVALPTNLEECRRRLTEVNEKLEVALEALDHDDKDTVRQILSEALGVLGLG
jgi:hypothetical protein